MQLITFAKCVSIIPRARYFNLCEFSLFFVIAEVSRTFQRLRTAGLCYNVVAVKALRVGRTVAMYAKKRSEVLKTRPSFRLNNSRFPL